MKWYNRKNYGKHKEELAKIKDIEIDLDDHETIIMKFINLPESIARTFSMSELASGRMNIEDAIQEGMVGLCIASKMVDKDMVENSTNQEKIIAAYLSIRVRGAIRRAIDNYRGTVKVGERAISAIRKGENVNQEIKDTFFGNILSQIDETSLKNSRFVVDINGELREYNYKLVVAYIIGVFSNYLTPDECTILKKWYGVGVRKGSLLEITRGFNGKYKQSEVTKMQEEATLKIEDKLNKQEIINIFYGN